MPGAQTTSLWLGDRPLGARGPLPADESTEICVVGAGISGLTTAYLLAREGARVLIVEARRIAAGESGRTTAHLVNVLDRRFTEIESARGVDGLRTAIESHARAIDEIEAIVAREEIPCDFERLDGYLVALTNPTELDEELAAAKRGGFDDVERLPDFTFGGLHGPALRFPRQAAVHPLCYFAGLADAVERAGGRIFESTAIRSIDEDGERSRLTTASGRKISASHVVVATNSPIDRSVSIHTKQAAYRTYVIGARVEPAMFPRALVAQLPRYLAPGEQADDGPPPGRAAIVRRGLKPIAAYRNEAGVLHERSAICPHLGCVVAWNESEASWDCPCHGSRFDALGRVIAGPAARDLAPIDEDTSEAEAVRVSKAVS